MATTSPPHPAPPAAAPAGTAPPAVLSPAEDTAAAALVTPAGTAPPARWDRGRLLRGGAVLLGGDVASKAVAFVTLVLIARRLPVAAFGRYSFAVGYAGFCVFFTDLGIDSITTRELVARPDEEEGVILGSALAIKGAVVAAALVASLASLLLFRPELRAAAAVGVVGLVAAVPGTVALLLNARIRVVAASAVQLAAALVTLAGVYAVLAAGLGPVGLMAVSSATTVAVGLVLAAVARRRGGPPLRVHGPTVRLLVRRAAPLALAWVGMVVYRRFDQVLLAGFGQVRQLGLYAAAVRLVDSLNIIPLGVAAILLPVLSRRESAAGGGAEPDRVTPTATRLLSSVILPLAALGTVAGGTILGTVYGAGFAGAGAVLAVLLWAHFFGFAGVLVDQVLIARGQTSLLARLTLAGAVLNVAVDVWAIPRFGAAGAAWGSLAAYALPFAAGPLLGRGRALFLTVLRAAVRPALAAVAVLVVLDVISPPPAALVPVFVVVTAAALVATGSVRVAEVVDLARSALRRSPV